MKRIIIAQDIKDSIEKHCDYDFLKRSDIELLPVEGNEQDLELQKLAFEVSDRINRVTPITPTSLVTLALAKAGLTDSDPVVSLLVLEIIDPGLIP